MQKLTDNVLATVILPVEGFRATQMPAGFLSFSLLSSARLLGTTQSLAYGNER